MKAILFDADGVTIKRQEKYFSDKFAEEYGAPKDQVVAFFRGKFRECQKGKADLKVELANVLPHWNWRGTVDDFLKYWFAESVPDEEVLAHVQALRKQGIQCCLATDQEKYRAEYLWKTMRDSFDDFFFSYQFGARKSEPQFFVEALKRLNVPASEVLYFDDEEEDIASARTLGIDARLYTGIGVLPRGVLGKTVDN